MWRNPSDDLEDWGDSFDDKDSGYWNELYSGPDDDEIEDYEAQREVDESCEDEAQCEIDECNEDEIVDKEDSEVNWASISYNFAEKSDNDTTNQNLDDLILSRKIEILSWLASSDIASIKPNGLGFFVPNGLYVKLKNGEVVEIIQWLTDEGIEGGDVYGEYSIVDNYTQNSERKGYDIYKIICVPFYINHDKPFPWRDDLEDLPQNN